MINSSKKVSWYSLRYFKNYFTNANQSTQDGADTCPTYFDAKFVDIDRDFIKKIMFLNIAKCKIQLSSHSTVAIDNIVQLKD